MFQKIELDFNHRVISILRQHQQQARTSKPNQTKSIKDEFF